MKSRLTNQTAAAVVFAVALVLLMGSASVARAADKQKIPKPPAGLPTPTTIDPATGLPLAPWIDPNWKDPDKILPEVVYDGLPIGEVVRHLRQEFKGEFDVLIPNGWQDPRYLSIDPQSASIRMQLKNVTASEVFSAMNLVFESEQAPYRWELKLNGNRPTALLRVLPQYLPVVAPPPPPTRMVYFVGDLIDTKPGGISMDQLVKTVSEIYKLSYGESKGVLQFHKDAQLLIVTGDSDQIGFVQQTLSALREKGRAAQSPQGNGGEPKAKTEDTKAR